MKRLTTIAACMIALSGCAATPQSTQEPQQASEKRFKEDDDYLTGSRIARKQPKNTPPAANGVGSYTHDGNPNPVSQ